MATVANAVQWWIIYMDGLPVAAGVGVSAENVLTSIRASSIGSIPETAQLKAVSVYEAPTDDVIRAFLPSIMMLLTNMAGGPPRGLRH